MEDVTLVSVIHMEIAVLQITKHAGILHNIVWLSGAVVSSYLISWPNLTCMGFSFGYVRETLPDFSYGCVVVKVSLRFHVEQVSSYQTIVDGNANGHHVGWLVSTLVFKTDYDSSAVDANVDFVSMAP